jgi:hypothetical protein
MTVEEKLKEIGWSDIEIARWKRLIRKLDEVYGGGSVPALEGPSELTEDLEKVAKSTGGKLYRKEGEE